MGFFCFFSWCPDLNFCTSETRTSFGKRCRLIISSRNHSKWNEFWGCSWEIKSQSHLFHWQPGVAPGSTCKLIILLQLVHLTLSYTGIWPVAVIRGCDMLDTGLFPDSSGEVWRRNYWKVWVKKKKKKGTIKSPEVRRRSVTGVVVVVIWSNPLQPNFKYMLHDGMYFGLTSKE